MKIKIKIKLFQKIHQLTSLQTLQQITMEVSLSAKKLIRLCAKAGADAAKFQHFKAETIVSDAGFKKLGKISHQSKWNKSVFET